MSNRVVTREIKKSILKEKKIEGKQNTMKMTRKYVQIYLKKKRKRKGIKETFEGGNASKKETEKRKKIRERKKMRNEERKWGKK